MGEKLTVSARMQSIDLAKSIAIACVVLIHVASEPLLWEAPNTGRWMQSLLWGSASRFAVPLFFLCSGALLLDENRGADARHIWTRRIPHILITLFFWASAYAFAPLLYHRSLCRETIAKALMDVLCWRHEQHLYFLHIMVLVYAALPVTRAFLRRADEKTIRYALALWAFSGVLLPTARALGLLFWLDGIPVQWALSLTWSSIGCTALGWRLRKKPLRAGTSIALVLLGFAICYVGTAVLSIRKGTLAPQLLEGLSPGPLMMAIGIFCLCEVLAPKLPNVLQRTAETFGKASFGIYLAHEFALSAFRVFGVTTWFASPLISIPALAFACLLLTFMGVFVMSKIPIVRRWLI